MLSRLKLLAIALAVLLFAGALSEPAAAQLPTAAGKQLTLSNAAWKLFIPSTYVQRPGAVADLLVHLHGDPQTFWNNAKYANLNSLIVTVNYSGLSSAYQTPFSSASLFQTIVDEALAKARLEANIPDNLQLDKLALSTFSAGYAGAREIFKSAAYRDQIDAYLAADSIHASTAGDGTPLDSQMADFKTFANLAKNGQKTFIHTHSQVPTSGYESTREVADEMIQYLGVTPTPVNQAGLGTLTYYRTAQTGNYKLWGTTGSDAAAHSRHLQYIGDFLEELPLARVPTQSADFTKQGTVDADDLALWQSSYGVNNLADANADGVSDGADFLAWQRQVGANAEGGATAAAVPEPAALRCSYTLCAACLLYFRRRSSK
jgi:hypothetical protein